MLDQHIYNDVLARARQHLPTLADTIESLGPIEIAGSPHPTIADQLFVEIINQQLSLRAADTIWSRVRAAAEARALPIRELLTEPHEVVLRACGVSGRKVKALRAVCEAEAQGLLDSEDLGRMAHEDRAARLTAIWGTGRWTADMLGIFYFRDTDIWPEGDVAVVGTLRRMNGGRHPHETAAGFAPYRSILARYLWKHRDQAAVQVAAA